MIIYDNTTTTTLNRHKYSINPSNKHRLIHTMVQKQSRVVFMSGW